MKLLFFSILDLIFLILACQVYLGMKTNSLVQLAYHTAEHVLNFIKASKKEQSRIIIVHFSLETSADII